MFIIPDELKIKTQISGVYQIKNIQNEKVYIGSSKDIYNRLCTHLRKLRNGKHDNKNIQIDFEKGNDFKCSVLRVLEYPTHQDLFIAERELTDNAQKEGRVLYNVIRLINDSYTPYNRILYYMADQYCMEKFGFHASCFQSMVPAKSEMLYECMIQPENEKKIREKYADAIKYQNKLRYEQSKNSLKNLIKKKDA